MGYGTIKTLTELGGLIFVPFQKTVTVTAGTTAAPVNTSLSWTVTPPTGTAFMTSYGERLGSNPLPYFRDDFAAWTVIKSLSWSSNTLSVTFRNTLGAWSNYTFSCILVFKKA